MRYNPNSSSKFYSSDMYVRLRRTDILDIALEYAYTEVIGKAHSVYPLGIIEWVGTHRHSKISIAWDWVMLSDGLFHVANDTTIRTNTLLIDALGYDIDPIETDRVWIEKIAKTQWQQILQENLPQMHY